MTLDAARRIIETSLVLFGMACVDLERIVKATGGKQLNQRKMKSRLAAVKNSYLVAI